MANRTYLKLMKSNWDSDFFGWKPMRKILKTKAKRKLEKTLETYQDYLDDREYLEKIADYESRENFQPF